MQSPLRMCAALRTASLAFLIGIALLPDLARADDTSGAVRLSVEACPTLAGERIRNILGAEIGPLLIAADADPAIAATDIVVVCEGTLTTLSLREPATGETLTREVQLDVVHPLARERLVAIAIAELISAAGIELEPRAVEAPEPAAEPVAPPEPEPEPIAVPVVLPEPRPRFQLSVLGHASTIGHPRRGMHGADLRFDFMTPGLLGVSAAIVFDRDRVLTEFGRVYAAVVGAKLEGTLNFHFGILTLQPAVGGRLSYAVFHGDGNAESVIQRTLRAPVFAPSLALRAFIRPTRRFFIVVGGELAVLTLTAHALVDGERAMSLSGPVLTAELGVGFAL